MQNTQSENVESIPPETVIIEAMDILARMSALNHMIYMAGTALHHESDNTTEANAIQVATRLVESMRKECELVLGAYVDRCYAARAGQPRPA